jgi:hypothetical protein
MRGVESHPENGGSGENLAGSVRAQSADRLESKLEESITERPGHWRSLLPPSRRFFVPTADTSRTRRW